MNAFAMAAANNHARAEKADPSQDALDDATDGVDLATTGHRHDGWRGAQSDQAERSQSRRLVVQVAVEPERATNTQRSAQAQGNVNGIHYRGRPPILRIANSSDLSDLPSHW